MAKKLIDVWKARDKILDGMMNSLFKKKYIEAIAKRRLSICAECKHLDKTGDKCFMPGTQPCCAICGCKLAWKARCLSEYCDIAKWEAILTDEEEVKIKEELGINDTE